MQHFVGVGDRREHAHGQVPLRSPFLVRPIWPSLGALCPSLCGLSPPPWPFTCGCPGLNWPAGPGCRGGPLGGMSSGIPEAPYISEWGAFCRSAARCPHSPELRVEWKSASLPQWHSTTRCMKQQTRRKQERGENRRESPRSLPGGGKVKTRFVRNGRGASESAASAHTKHTHTTTHTHIHTHFLRCLHWNKRCPLACFPLTGVAKMSCPAATVAERHSNASSPHCNKLLSARLLNK